MAYKRTLTEHIRATGQNVRGLCAQAGISRPTFYSVIGGSNSKIETLEAIAKAAGVTVDQVRANQVDVTE